MPLPGSSAAGRAPALGRRLGLEVGRLGPLSGVTVLDLSRLLPGPFAAWLLRSWGARVIKVEDTEAGDYLREMQPVWFEHLNAGAESVAINLKREQGRAIFLRLAARADVVLEGFRPGVMERLGLGYEALRQVNPRLVLVSITGGLGGRAGHDINYLARSGLLSLMSEVPPVQLADLAGGLSAAAGALAAVIGARATGVGSHVEASLLDALFGLGSLLAAESRAGHDPVREQMLLAGALPCYTIYATADGGRVTLGALEAKFWRRFCAVAGHPEWEERQLDPALRPELEAFFRSRPLSDWAVLAEAEEICLEPVLSIRQAVADRAGLQPVQFDGLRPESGVPAPGRGAHTVEILREAGLSQQEILALASEGVIDG